MPLTLTGEEAAIRWGYQVACLVTSWTVTQGGGGFVLSATIAHRNTYRLSQRPLVFMVARYGGVMWRWPIVELQMTGASLSATLGPKEE